MRLTVLCFALRERGYGKTRRGSVSSGMPNAGLQPTAFSIAPALDCACPAASTATDIARWLHISRYQILEEQGQMETSAYVELDYAMIRSLSRRGPFRSLSLI